MRLKLRFCLFVFLAGLEIESGARYLLRIRSVTELHSESFLVSKNHVSHLCTYKGKYKRNKFIKKVIKLLCSHWPMQMTFLLRTTLLELCLLWHPVPLAPTPQHSLEDWAQGPLGSSSSPPLLLQGPPDQKASTADFRKPPACVCVLPQMVLKLLVMKPK